MMGDPIRFQFDLHADEQQKQTIEPDAEVAEQRDERIGEHGGNQPADEGYDMDNEASRHLPLLWLTPRQYGTPAACLKGHSDQPIETSSN